VSTSLSSARPASPAEAPILLFAHAHEWAAARKGTTLRSLPYAEAVDVALCYGWIDSLTRRHDDRSRVQKFTPRRTRSSWSRINCDKVAALAAAGRMRPAGLLAVERVRATGRWCGGDPTA
jgi:uncharacterized protein YdeI (YjbR/CyaY-like superfamily)